MQAISHEPSETPGPDELRERAEYHAERAEKLVRSWWLSSHIQGQLHATLALYYATRQAANRR